VYENALVRRTEAEIAAQSAAIAATAALLWSGSAAADARALEPFATDSRRSILVERYELPVPEIDLRSSSILQARPAAKPVAGPPSPDAQLVATRRHIYQKRIEPLLGSRHKVTE
jgi:hypothetical protein